MLLPDWLDGVDFEPPWSHRLADQGIASNHLPTQQLLDKPRPMLALLPFHIHARAG
jgi:hypothetical protein